MNGKKGKSCMRERRSWKTDKEMERRWKADEEMQQMDKRCKKMEGGTRQRWKRFHSETRWKKIQNTTDGQEDMEEESQDATQPLMECRS